jgi:hypothetical protein
MTSRAGLRAVTRGIDELTRPHGCRGARALALDPKGLETHGAMLNVPVIRTVADESSRCRPTSFTWRCSAPRPFSGSDCCG